VTEGERHIEIMSDRRERERESKREREREQTRKMNTPSMICDAMYVTF
jgi:hypothetical protein